MKIKKNFFRYIAVFLLFTGGFTRVYAGEVRVAVAANFTAPMKVIAKEFEKQTGHNVTLSFGSSGKFYAQMRAGAPYDVFVSADEVWIQKLSKEGLTIPESQFIYAVGKLVLWSKNPALVDRRGEILKKGNFHKVAMANPKLAPYGMAAEQTLKALGLWQKIQPRVVMGENTTQAYQFADTQNAELAFLAYSQVLKNGELFKGSLWVVPAHLYAPLSQSAVLLKRVKDREASSAFLKFLQSPNARAVIQRYGYEIP